VSRFGIFVGVANKVTANRYNWLKKSLEKVGEQVSMQEP